MGRRRNILLLMASFGQPGGTQRYLSELGELLAERHNVLVCSFNAFEEPHFFQNRNTVVSLGVRPPAGAVAKAFGYLRKAYRLRQVKRQHEIDITISHLFPADFINALSRGRGRMVSVGVVNVVGNRQNRRMLEYRKAVGWLYRRFDMTVGINPALTEELGSLFCLPSGKLACIPAFVTPPDLREPRPDFLKRRPRLAWFGRLNHMKNLTPLFEILTNVKHLVPDVQLLVIGEGPHHDELVTAARASGLRVSDHDDDRDADVVFLGFLPDPQPYLRQCDLFVLTSLSEGFGLVIVEAMSVGLPVLASDCPTGGPHFILEGAEPYRIGRTTVEETRYGYLLPVPEVGNRGIASLWETAICELLRNEVKRKKKGSEAMERAAAFSRDSIKEKWFQVVDSL